MKSILLSVKPALMILVLFSFVTNLAVLVSPLFMMQVLDRVIPSGNLNTLFLLGILAFGALAINAVVEYFRDQTLSRIGTWVESEGARFALSRPAQHRVDSFQAVDTLSHFLGGRGASTLLDAPWVILFLLALTLIHPAFLVVAIIAAAVFIGLNIASDLTEQRSRDAIALQRRTMAQTMRNFELIGPAAGSMGIGSHLGARYTQAHDRQLAVADQNAKVQNAFGSTSRAFRTLFQIGTLAVGAALVTLNQLTAGGMIGASIILAKTLGIIEGTIALRPALKDAKSAWIGLSSAPSTTGSPQIEVHDLSGALKAHNLTYPKAAGHLPRIDRISFYLEPGTCLAILGESGSGKTTLLNALSGIDPAPIGNCFLDETDVRTIDQTRQTDVIGYVPQNTVLTTGTIAENIARFSADIDDDQVIAAAKLAGVHGAISALPAAYNTDLGAEPFALSAGQQQRIAFARAIYERPKYLFLDEPNALLDHQSERALGDALVRLKAMGVTIILTAHRISIVQIADKVAVMELGRLIDFGDRKDILGKMTDGHRKFRVGVQDGALEDLCDYVARQFVRGGDDELRQRAIKVATELFNFAKGNGAQTADRSLHFAFKFIDDDTCTITLSEYRSTKLEAKIKKVRDASKDALPASELLTDDEISLAQVMQLSDSLQHKSDQGETALCARITHLPAPEARLQ